jgi:hypothetical protein
MTGDDGCLKALAMMVLSRESEGNTLVEQPTEHLQRSLEESAERSTVPRYGCGTVEHGQPPWSCVSPWRR